MYPQHAGGHALSLAASMASLHLNPANEPSLIYQLLSCTYSVHPLLKSFGCLRYSMCFRVVCATCIAPSGKPISYLCHVLQFAPGTLLVPRSNASSHLDTAMQMDQHSIYMEQHMLPPDHGHPYMSNDSILLQHYAEMAPVGDAGNAVQADSHMHASSGFDTGPGGMVTMYTVLGQRTVCAHSVCLGPEYQMHDTRTQ